MDQLYMLEILIEEIILKPGINKQCENETRLLVNIKFGPIFDFQIRQKEFTYAKQVVENVKEAGEVKVKIESEEEVKMESEVEKKDDEPVNEEEEQDEVFNMKVGKSFMFVSYPDTLLQSFNRFPIEFSIYNDCEFEKRTFIGVAKLNWDPKCYDVIRVSSCTCENIEPLILKKTVCITDECCCEEFGEMTMLIRLKPLGKNVVTGFQYIPKNESFVFKTNKIHSSFIGRKYKQNEQSCIDCTMVGCIYETANLKDISEMTEKELMAGRCALCNKGNKEEDGTCCPSHQIEYEEPDKPKTTIKIKDIVGPCGHTHCPLAEKIKIFLKSTDAYKADAKDNAKKEDDKKGNDKKGNVKKITICGYCVSEGNRFHSNDCAKLDTEAKIDALNKFKLCDQCNGLSLTGKTCKDDSRNKEVCKAVCEVYSDWDTGIDYRTIAPADSTCICVPPPLEKTCNAFDCACKEKEINEETRKHHKSYCPLYKHKNSCPTNMINNNNMNSDHGMEVFQNKEDESHHELEGIDNPFGLPPLKIGPCPVLGRPCTVPDGFARLYAPREPVLPPSYSEAGNVCCPAEFSRIKTFLNDLMKEDEPPPDCCYDILREMIPLATCCKKSPTEEGETKNNC